MSAIEKIEQADTAPTLPAPVTPMEMLANAVAKGASIETLEKLMTLQERYEANQAKRDFNEAVAAAKADIDPIVKNKRVSYGHKNSESKTNYTYETFDAIARAVDPVLAQYGLSYGFEIEQANGAVSVTCVLSHKHGHSEKTTLSGPRDDSGKKNAIQSIGSSVTYLQRYTLKACLGLAVTDDDDGQASETPMISTEQVNQIQAALDAAQSSAAELCKYFGFTALPQIPAKDFDRVMQAISQYKRPQDA